MALERELQSLINNLDNILRVILRLLILTLYTQFEKNVHLDGSESSERT